MKTTAIYLSLLSLALSACGSVVDDNPDPSGADATTTTTPDPDATPGQPDARGPVPDGANPVCDTETTVCANAAPAGWKGPVIYAEATPGNGPSCPTGFKGDVESSFASLDAGGASCGCTCGEATGMTCNSVNIGGYGSASCPSGITPIATVNNGGCQNSIPNSTYYKFTAPNVSGGSCTPTGSEDIDTPTWGTEVVTCELSASLDACGEGVSCAPRPGAEFANRLCIVSDGDNTCPAGDYSERFVRHRGYTDSRSCGSCTCGAPQGSCGGTVQISHNSSALTCTGGILDATLSSGQCGYAPSGTQARYIANPVASCSASSPSVSGSVTKSDAVTYCCMDL